jgi:drug/metabolite transporter (DMT)-like permease
MAALLALAAALTYGIADFCGGFASRRVPVMVVLVLSQAIGLAGLLVAAPLVGASHVDQSDLLFGVAAGLIGLVGVFLLYRGFAIGRMSVVAPLTAVLSAVVPVAVGLGLGERPGVFATLGIVLAIPAIALSGGAGSPQNGSRQPHERQAIVMALLAGVGFGLFFALLDQAGDSSGLWPLVAGRVATTLAALGCLMVIPLPPRRAIASVGVWVLATGLLEVTANVLFLLATREGALSLASVITALYPATTVLLALVVLGERLTRRQIYGLALAAIAVVLIALP